MTHDVFSILSNSANGWSMQVGSAFYYPKGFFSLEDMPMNLHTPKLPLHAWSGWFQPSHHHKTPQKNIQSNPHPIKTMSC